ncbi:hypothetical protein JX266_013645 [Neoarthrinium moseri]|nr:hypothetical protein JX266_013645 [Neoarthrinium moseri]
MDDNVHKSVTLTCWTAKGQFTVKSEIEDLHALCATCLLWAHGTKFHNLTFPAAIYFNLPVRGVVTCAGAQEPFNEKMLLKSVDGRPITDTTQLKAIMDRIWSSRDKPFICISQEKLRNPDNAVPVSGYLLQATDQVSCDMTREPHQGGSWAITSMSLPKSTSSPFGKTGREQSTLWKDAGSKEALETLPDRLSSLQLADSDTPHKIVKIFSSFTLLNSHRDICIDGNSNSNRLFGVMFDVEKALCSLSSSGSGSGLVVIKALVRDRTLLVQHVLETVVGRLDRIDSATSGHRVFDEIDGFLENVTGHIMGLSSPGSCPHGTGKHEVSCWIRVLAERPQTWQTTTMLRLEMRVSGLVLVRGTMASLWLSIQSAPRGLPGPILQEHHAAYREMPKSPQLILAIGSASSKARYTMDDPLSDEPCGVFLGLRAQPGGQVLPRQHTGHRESGRSLEAI